MSLDQRAAPKSAAVPAGPARLDDLERLLDQAAAWAAERPQPNVFVPRLLDSLARATGGRGASLWTCDADGRWQRRATAGESNGDGIGSLFSTAGGGPKLVLPGGRAAADGPEHPGPNAVLLAPFSPMRALEVAVPPEIAGTNRPLLLEVGGSFAEIARDYFEGRELADLRETAGRWRGFESFLRAIHEPLSPMATAYAIAGDGRRVVTADRTAVAIGRGGRVAVVSGVDVLDPRSDAVRALSALAAAAVRSGRPRLSLRPEVPPAEPLPAKLAAAWDRYRQVVPATATEVVVLSDRSANGRSPQPVGAWIAECFGEVPDDFADRVTAAAPHVELALANALRASVGPLGRLRRRVGASGLVKTALVLSLLAAAVAALAMIPADFTVPARGRLRPVAQHDVFAPRDGVVVSLPVRHGQRVARGATLLAIADPELNLEIERAVGEIRTTQQRLAGVRAARATAVGADRAGRSSSWAAEEKELEERLANYQRQLELLEAEQANSTVLSPIDGIVLTWEAVERLRDRPVRRGQRLLTVAHEEGDWLLELFVADRRAGPLLDAHRGTEPIEIDYLMATDPTRTHHETVDDVSQSCERFDAGGPTEGGEPVVRVTATVPRDQVPDPRPGATAVAKIHCGRRPLGEVWFHDLFDAVRTHVLF